MNDMNRQHLISLIFLGAMALWIGGAAALYSFTGLGGSIPPSIVVEQAALEGEYDLDENYADRYLDWRESSRPRAALRPPYSPRPTVKQGTGPTMWVGKVPPPPQVRGGPAC